MPSVAERRNLGPPFKALAGALLFLSASAGAQPDVEMVPSGTVRSGDLVTLGRKVVVEGVVDGTVVSIGGDVTVTGKVSGDLLVLGGNGSVTGGGQVVGDLLVLGGEARAEAGGVAGRIRTVAAVEAAFLAELKTSPFRPGGASLMLGAFRLALLSFWLVVGLALLRFGPRRVQAAASAAEGELLVAAGLGVSAVLSGLLLATFFLALLPPQAGLVLVVLVSLLLIAAKAFGLSALFVCLGRLLLRRTRRGSPWFGDPAALAVGLVIPGLVSLVPGVGPLVWGALSIVGIGLSARTAFGAFRPVLTVARA